MTTLSALLLLNGVVYLFGGTVWSSTGYANWFIKAWLLLGGALNLYFGVRT
jgi:hypothetical protein